MIKKPGDILNEWMLAVNNGDIESLLALYNEKAILIPTFSNRLLSNSEQIREYFEKLGSREELSVALHEKTLTIQPIKNDIYALCGIYCWRFILDGELLSFEARFSYVVDLALSKPIIQHHSSQIPRML
ncbi:DUF4440 domain-containing protein [Candidatus Desantisbacteria bacterium]|nr:DUF4440 domain-containing protein [Candidatus Desantisbacteria bacterium]